MHAADVAAAMEEILIKIDCGSVMVDEAKLCEERGQPVMDITDNDMEVDSEAISSITFDGETSRVLSSLIDKVCENVDGDGEVVTSLLNELVDKVASQSGPSSESVNQSDTVVEAIDESDGGGASQSVSEHMYARPSSSSASLRCKDIVEPRFQERKRRSARVKTTTSKAGAPLPTTKQCGQTKAEPRDLLAELEEIIPSQLRNIVTPEHGYNKALEVASDDVMTPDRTNKTRRVSVERKEIPGEAEDVQRFLEELSENTGLVHVIREWIYRLAGKRHYSWTSELINVYVNVYNLHQPCYQRPNILSTSSATQVGRDAIPPLLWLELMVDRSNRTDNRAELHQLAFTDDFTYWGLAVGHEGVNEEFNVRFLYMAAQFYASTYQPLPALSAYHRLLEIVSQGFSVCLPNATGHSIITSAIVEDELKLLERAQSLDELQSVFDGGDHVKVIELLSATFDLELKRRFSDSRHSQLLVLLDSLEKIGINVDYLCWLGEVLAESIYHSDKGARGDWATIICRTLSVISMKLDGSDVQASAWNIGIVKKCLTIIKVNAESLEDEKTTPVESLEPWIILSKLTKGMGGESAAPADSTLSSPTKELPIHIRFVYVDITNI